VCIWGIEQTWWDNGVVILILLNTLQLAMFDPLDNEANLPVSHVTTGKAWPFLGRNVLDIIGLFFTAAFTLECVVKIIAMGVVRGRNSYLAQSSNWLDFFVVAIGLVDFAGDQVDLGAFSALRLLRILRVLRVVTRDERLKQMVVVLIGSVPLMFSTVVTLMMVLLIFGILGVQLYKGALHGRCFNVDSGQLEHEDFCGVDFIESDLDAFWIAKGMQMTSGGILRCSQGTSACLPQGENPGRGAIHFDNIFNGVVTIFQIMTLEGWADLCYQLQDSNSFWSIVYFLVLVFLGPYFAVQLFLVVLSTAFENLTSKARKALSKGSFNFIQQAKQKVEMVKRKSKVSGPNTKKPPPPTGLQRFRAKVRALAKDETLNNIVLGFILLNTLSMCTEGVCDFETHGWCVNFTITVELFNVLFTFVFAAEAVVKLVGLGPMDYFRPGNAFNVLNIFDFLIVVASLVELPGTFATLSCYMAPLEASWLNETVRLSTDIPDQFLSAETIAALTVPKAIMNTTTNPPVLEVNPAMYYHCGSGGFISVMRALRLVRLVKFLRGFPEIYTQVKILLAVINDVTPLFVLIGILLLVFTVLGMNLFGNGMTAEWDEELLVKGAEVFVVIPGDLNGEVARHAKINDIDGESHPYAPYRILLDYAVSFPDVVNKSVGYQLDELGMLWVAAAQDGTALQAPTITSIVPRFHFDNLAHAVITTFQVPSFCVACAAYWVLECLGGGYELGRAGSRKGTALAVASGSRVRVGFEQCMTMANWNDDLYDAYAGTGVGSGLGWAPRTCRLHAAHAPRTRRLHAAHAPRTFPHTQPDNLEARGLALLAARLCRACPAPLLTSTWDAQELLFLCALDCARQLDVVQPLPCHPPHTFLRTEELGVCSIHPFPSPLPPLPRPLRVPPSPATPSPSPLSFPLPSFHSTAVCQVPTARAHA